MPEEIIASEQQEEASGFTPITTQEEFDKAVKARLERANRHFRADNKDVFEKAKAYDELVEKNKSDLDKANDRAAKAEKELEALKRKGDIAAWKQEVSKETGIPADVLRGETREEIAAHAESLREAFPRQKEPYIQSDGFAASSGKRKETRDQFAETLTNFLGGR